MLRAGEGVVDCGDCWWSGWMVLVGELWGLIGMMVLVVLVDSVGCG